MTQTVLTFQPGDPVPPWFVDVEPRHDVPSHMPRLAAPLEFAASGRIVDEGDRYAVVLDGPAPKRRAIVGDLYYCHLVVEKPILWADGTYWPGGGVPSPLGWEPDPARVKRIADVERSRAALLSGELYIEPDVQALAGVKSSYYKAAAIFGAALVVWGVIIGAVAAVVAVMT
jgi:hypothetical protein